MWHILKKFPQIFPSIIYQSATWSKKLENIDYPYIIDLMLPRNDRLASLFVDMLHGLSSLSLLSNDNVIKETATGRRHLGIVF